MLLCVFLIKKWPKKAMVSKAHRRHHVALLTHHSAPRWKAAYLASIVQELMFKLLDPENVLEHLVELLFAQNQLRGCAGGHPGLLLPGVLFPTVDGIELGHPGTQHRLLAEAIDFREAAHPLLDVLLEDLPRVISRAAPTLHHAGHTVALQEDLSENRARKDIRKSVLETSSQASSRPMWSLPQCLLAVQTQLGVQMWEMRITVLSMDQWGSDILGDSIMYIDSEPKLAGFFLCYLVAMLLSAS